VGDDRLFVASADGHVGIPTEQYGTYLEERYRDEFRSFLAEHRQRWSASEPTSVLDPAAWEWFEGNERFESGGMESLADPVRRLKELDEDGVAVEVLFTDDQNDNAEPWLGGGLLQSALHKAYPPELQLAGARAYNRWLAEYCSAAPERLLGCIAIPTLADVAAAVAEVRRAHADGLRHAVLLPLEYHEPLVHHPKNEPFWQVCEELDLTIAVHLGNGSPDWVGDDEWAFAIVLMETFFFAHRPLWCLIFGGVLERHPDLRFVFTEQGADWVPSTVARMDFTATGKIWRSAREHPMPHLPSELFHRQCFVANSIMQRGDIEMREQIGTDVLIWGSDFPHHEGMWPTTRERMRGLFAGVPEADVRKIVGDNFLRAYKVDPASYDRLVSQIGPSAADLGAST
jgi:predicted TIM-barrel fold metal-dependent hydrolase